MAAPHCCSERRGCAGSYVDDDSSHYWLCFSSAAFVFSSISAPHWCDIKVEDLPSEAQLPFRVNCSRGSYHLRHCPTQEARANVTKRKASDATSPAFDTAVAVAAEEVSPAKRIKAQPDFTDTKVVSPCFACL